MIFIYKFHFNITICTSYISDFFHHHNTILILNFILIITFFIIKNHFDIYFLFIRQYIKKICISLIINKYYVN